MIVVEGEHWAEPATSHARFLGTAPADRTAATLTGQQLLVLFDGYPELGAQVAIPADPQPVRILVVSLPSLLAIGIPARLAFIMQPIFPGAVLRKLFQRLILSAVRTSLSASRDCHIAHCKYQLLAVSWDQAAQGVPYRPRM